MNYQLHSQFILHKIHSLNAKNIVLQIPEQYLIQSIHFQNQLKLSIQSANIYLLYDSNKRSCCTDIIGAKHVNYDILIHFGYACFSQKYNPKHIYIYPEQPKDIQSIQINIQQLLKNEIDGIVLNQNYYNGKLFNKVRAAIEQLNLKQQGKHIQILRLLPDKIEGQDQYFIFGYCKKKSKKLKNLLLLGFQQDFQQKLYLIREKIKISKLFNYQNEKIVEISLNTNKQLMKRLSLINKIKDVDRFGILVSNSSTQFCLQSIKITKKILKQNNKAYYIFMMNNLNQAKLGNFPQIQCYVIISCFNNSLFNLTDFHYLVVTPFDISIAFAEQINLSTYDFDNRNKILQNQTQQEKQIIQQGIIEGQLVKANNEMDVKRIFQTLEYHKERSFKGLQKQEIKQVKKMSKGKIGLAQQYKDLD